MSGFDYSFSILEHQTICMSILTKISNIKTYLFTLDNQELSNDHLKQFTEHTEQYKKLVKEEILFYKNKKDEYSKLYFDLNNLQK